MKKLYKYITPDSLNIILHSSSIKITNPIEFNDPFDCNVPEFELNIDDLKKSIGKKLGGSKNDRKQALFEINNDLEKLASDLQKDSGKLSSVWEEVIAQFRVLSLTEKFDNILMWSHYSDNHKGAVIGFNRYEDTGFIKNSKPINYNNGTKSFKEFSAKLVKILLDDITRNPQNYDEIEYKELVLNSITKSTLNFFTSYFYFKRYEWSYEKEHRLVLPYDSNIIKNNGTIDTIAFETSDICEIIFGVKTKQTIIDACKKIVKEKYPDIKLHQMKKVGWNLQLKEI